jgi:hypothetical protein
MQKNNGSLALLSLGLLSLACPTRTIDTSDGSIGGRAGSAAEGAAGSAGTAGVIGTSGAAGSNGDGRSGAGGGGVGGVSAGTGGGAGSATAGSNGGRGVGGIGGEAGGGSGGTAGSSPGKILWARSASSAFLYGVAEGSVGVVVSGVLSGPANLGGSVLTPDAASSVALAEYSPSDGSHLFSTTFGNGSPSGTGVVYGHLDVLAAGTPIIQGLSRCNPAGTPVCNQFDVGLGPLALGGGPGDDGFIGRYSITTGQATWVDRLIGPGTDVLVASTLGPTNTIFTVGFYDQSTSLISGTNAGTAQSLPGAGDKDIVIMQESDVTGEIGMVKTYADAAYEQPYGIAWTGSNIILSGLFNGTMTAFGGSLQSQDVDIFVAKLSLTGTPVWVKPLGGAGPEGPTYVTVDAAGDIYLAGQISGSAMLGTYPVGGFGGLDVFVAKLNNGDGSVAWATSFGSSGDDNADAITINGAAQIFVTASIAGPLTSGGPSFGGIDAALVSYSKTGSHLWTKIVGTSGTDYGYGAAASSDGSFYANVDLGANIGPTIEGVTILGASAPTGLLLKIAP